MNKQEAHNEVESLRGNINRMFVTNDKDEFERMALFARKRLDRIIEYNTCRLYYVPEELEDSKG